MSKQSIAEKVKAFLEPIVAELGYELVDVDFGKKSTGLDLTIFIDNQDGITLEDCEKVHKTIDGPLDQLDPIDGAYTLNVSSCGLDWIFRSNRDYQRNVGNIIDITLYAPINRKKNYTGKLIAFDGTNVIIEQSEQISLPKKAIAKATRHIEF